MARVHVVRVVNLTSLSKICGQTGLHLGSIVVDYKPDRLKIFCGTNCMPLVFHDRKVGLVSSQPAPSPLLTYKALFPIQSTLLHTERRRGVATHAFMYAAR